MTNINLRWILEESFEEFVRWNYFETFGKHFVMGEHHKKIIDELVKVFNGQCNRLVINIPPRYGKTELLAQFCLWCFLKNKNCNFIYATYASNLCRKVSGQVRDNLMLPHIQELWNIRISKKTKSKIHWKVENGGEFYAASTKGQIIGFGAGILGAKDFSGGLIIDDPMNSDDRFSNVVSEKIIENFDGVLSSRINDKTTPIIVIMQRLSLNDLSEHIKNNYPEYKFLVMPILNDKKEPLWPYRDDMESIKLIMRKEERFESQYMQRPENLSGMYPFLNCKVVDNFKFTGETAAFVDPAYEGEDYTAVSIVQLSAGKIWVYGIAMRKAWDDCLEEFKVLTKVNRVAFETNGVGKFPVKILRKLNLKVTGRNNTEPKRKRIVTASVWKDDIIFVSDGSKENQAYIDMCKKYCYNAPRDDAPDSLASAMQFMGLINFKDKI